MTFGIISWTILLTTMIPVCCCPADKMTVYVDNEGRFYDKTTGVRKAPNPFDMNGNGKPKPASQQVKV